MDRAHNSTYVCTFVRMSAVLCTVLYLCANFLMDPIHGVSISNEMPMRVPEFEGFDQVPLEAPKLQNGYTIVHVAVPVYAFLYFFVSMSSFCYEYLSF